MPRDEFPRRVVQVLAKRAGWLCSICGSLTTGPNSNPQRAVNVGEAAHITAASKGGPRYDENLTTAQRRSASNGIWLCRICAKIIDDDRDRYTAPALRRQKAQHEALIDERLRPGTGPVLQTGDEQILAKLSRVLDRPAMTTPFREECSLADFEKAITDTIEALNTGVHRLRDGTQIARIPSRHDLHDAAARTALAEIVRALGELRSTYQQHLRTGALRVHDDHIHIGGRVADDLDDRRARILDAFRRIRPEFSVRLSGR